MILLLVGLLVGVLVGYIIGVSQGASKFVDSVLEKVVTSPEFEDDTRKAFEGVLLNVLKERGIK